MIEFLLALQFLTIIPVKVKHAYSKKISNSMIFFPIVGLLLGLILIGINNLILSLGIEKLYSNIILVISLIILTGGIHLDGLADTLDGLLSRKNKEEILRIMRDSHIGAMGVLGLISIILLKFSFLSCIYPQTKIISLLLMCILSRWAMVLSIFLFPYARQEGKAKDFLKEKNTKVLFISTLLTLLFALVIWRIRGLGLTLAVAILTWIGGRYITKKIGGITGDTLGATNEIMETVVLFCVIIIERIYV